MKSKLSCSAKMNNYMFKYIFYTVCYLGPHTQYAWDTIRNMCFLGTSLIPGTYSIPAPYPFSPDLAMCLASEAEWALEMAHTITVVMKPVSYPLQPPTKEAPSSCIQRDCSAWTVSWTQASFGFPKGCMENLLNIRKYEYIKSLWPIKGKRWDRTSAHPLSH